MAVTDKTRKILWGKSGSLCAFCKTHLVLDASVSDSESVVGEECHIVSKVPGGPRYDATIDPDSLDFIENLVLLCRIHHKLVDDQAATFSVEALKLLKQNHEKWVQERLSQNAHEEQVKIVRLRGEIPKQLILTRSAQDLLNLMSRCHGRYDGYPDDLAESELDLVGAFLQDLSDWGDVGLDGPLDWIRAQKSIAKHINDLNQAGLELYVGREKQQLRGGSPPATDWYMLHLQIARQDDTN